MEERYNVYFAGQIIDGHDPATVRSKLAKLFNADQSTLDKLFSGQAQLIKRDCDKLTAVKYKDAMERAGAVALVKIAESKSATPAPPAPGTPAKATPAKSMTAAERIAALAAAPDEIRYRQPAAGAPSGNLPDTAQETGGIGLAPPGTAVLREDERAEHVIRDVDTTGLAVDIAAARLSEEPPPPPAAPDTRHLSMGEVGETLPNLPSSAQTVSPNLDGLALIAPGTDFSDCVQPAPKAPPLDLSALVLASPGTTLLDDRYRKKEQRAAPSTEHISLKE